MTQTREWQGKLGKVWADQAVALDRVLDPVGQLGIDAIGALGGAVTMDLGCGAGSSSRALAAQGAKVTGIDISKDLLDLARRKSGLSGIKYQLADAAMDDLCGEYDVLFSRFGTMFFDDPVPAWTHIRNQVGGDCRFSFVTWQPLAVNDWARVPILAATPVLGAAATSLEPSVGPGPFAWAEPEAFVSILAGAGWRDIEWKPVERMAQISMGNKIDPVDRAVEFAMTTGPLASRTKGVPPEQRSAIANLLAPELQKHLRDDVVQLSTSAWIIEGRS